MGKIAIDHVVKFIPIRNVEYQHVNMKEDH